MKWKQRFSATIVLMLMLGTYLAAHAQVRLESHEGVRQVMWSPDGTRLVTANPDGLVRIWDASGQLVTSFIAHPNGTRTVAWHPDGVRLATGGADNFVRIWDDNGTLLAAFETDFDGTFELVWHPDGIHLVTLGFNIVSVWDAFSGQLISHLPAATAIDMNWNIHNNQLAIINLPNFISIYDGSSFDILFSISEANVNIFDAIALNAITWKPDGTQIASGSVLGTLRFWDVATQTDLGVIAELNSLVQDLAYSPDGSRIAVALDSGIVHVLDANTGAILHTYSTNGTVLSVDWKPDSSEFAYVGIDDDTDADNDLQIVPAPQSASSFTLINADTNMEISPLTDNDTVDLTTLDPSNLAIRANTTPATVGSVVFDLNGTTQTDDTARYELTDWTPTPGAYALTATPYSGAGAAGSPLTIRFRVVDDS